MSGSPIIDARRCVPWRRRLISDVCTIALWAVWLRLWAPVWTTFGSLADLAARSQAGALRFLAGGLATAGVQHGFVALAGISGALLVWKGLPARSIREASALAPRDQARHFGLAEDALSAGRLASVCVVHHDESGRIVRVECRPASRRDEAIAA
ncbi:MAG TPA: poly-beta-1,6-N-acetyl-D-glucosamine biosynthesis protein PgaD [Anaeromyxobacteraceae bacterium]|nr:poly-beta-1,6-N-acetyl-D-glucosamine biosynthesis protein PgaD [Anaeromyxobacteraceae bacterium]